MYRYDWRHLVLIFLTLLLLASPAVACANTVPDEPNAPALKITPQVVKPDEMVSISLQIKNISKGEETRTISLTINGAKVQTKVVRIAPGKAEAVTFTVTEKKPGIYEVQVDNLTGTFRVVKPAEFTVGNLSIIPHVARPGQMITVSADITNSGEVEGIYSVVIMINDNQTESKDVTVAPGATKTVDFTFTRDAIGSYSIEVDGLSGVAIVTEKDGIVALLRSNSPELYEELLKLPDLQEIDDRDNEAIEDIAYLALNSRYRSAFETMLNEGIKDRRKYCAPLEALLWIAYDREFDKDNPLQDYSLEKLINDAWQNTTTSKNFTSARWQDFDEVVDRLNSPQMIVSYLKNTFTYVLTLKWMRDATPAKEFFDSRKGACMDHAAFAAYCLKQNGYDDVRGLEIRFDKLIEGVIGHVVCLYWDPANNAYYVIDNILPSSMHGPYKSVESAAADACIRATGGKAKLSYYNTANIDLSTGKFR